jgi:hypothetical protein
MERQAIMGTYVLHERTFPCKRAPSAQGFSACEFGRFADALGVRARETGVEAKEADMTAEIQHRSAVRHGRSLGAIVWFVWMVGMWAGFFALLAADRLDEVWSWVRDFPLVVEGLLWFALFPWLLGTAAWTSSWPDALRIVLVMLFAAGWTLASLPRRSKEEP